jgi:hypothetical protein
MPTRKIAIEDGARHDVWLAAAPARGGVVADRSDGRLDEEREAERQRREDRQGRPDLFGRDEPVELETRDWVATVISESIAVSPSRTATTG